MNPKGPTSLLKLQSRRFFDSYSRTVRSWAITMAMTNSLPRRRSFGSRKSWEPMSMTGLPAYRANVRPPSVLYASDCR